MMDLHRTLLSCMCRLCGRVCDESSATKLSSKQGLTKDIFKCLNLNLIEDKSDVHPPSICDICRLKVTRWKTNRYRRKKDLQPPNIDLHVFTEHDTDCQICADRQWNTDVLLDYFKRNGMFAWKEEEEVVGVVVDRGGNGILKKVTVKENNVESFVLGKKLNLQCRSIDELKMKFLDAAICPGNGEFQELAARSNEFGLKSHTGVTTATVEGMHFDGRILQPRYSIRHINCEMIIPQSVANASNRSLLLCNVCAKYKSSLHRTEESHKSRQGGKAKSVPTKFLSPDELREKIDALNKEKAMLNQQKRRLMDKVAQLLKEESVEFMEEEAGKLHDIVSQSRSSIESLLPPGSYCDLLWKQQMEAASKPSKQMRWHPAVLRWAIAIHTKSAAAYNVVRESGYLTLPHPTTLYKYTHFTNPHAGLNTEVLMKFYAEFETDSRSMHERYVALLMDEMKISSCLAISRSTGKLIGFCDIGSISTEMENFENRCTSNEKREPALASHVLLFMARGITSSLKFPVAYYATSSLKGSQLHEMANEAIMALKLLGLTVLCLVSDGAASNRKLYQNLGGQGSSELTPEYFCTNWLEVDDKIFFICDTPHLLKTLRNNVENSNWNRKTRNLIFDGQRIQWTDIISFMEWDQGTHRANPGLRLAPKLTPEHLYLTPGLRMKVRLAAQVMSNTVANGLEMMQKKTLSSTILLIRNVNKFFDCLNVARQDQGLRSRNENLKPYTSVDDPRFEWLLNEFLAFLTQWANECDTIEGLTKKEKSQLCISRQTISGIYITVHSFVEIAQKLLKMEGVSYILSDKLNQDPIEEFFGKQRAAGGHRDNPTLEQFGHAFVRNISAGGLLPGPSRGNVRRRDEPLPLKNQEPLPKRKKVNRFGSSNESPI